MKRLLSTFLFFATPSFVLLTTTACPVDKYNQLVELDEECVRAWSDVEIQYQRRMDLIPSLLSTVKASAAHEHTVLLDLEKAQKAAQLASQGLAENPTPEQIKAFEASQANLTTVIGRMPVVQDAFPELKAPFEHFMVNLEGTENRISIARQKYNDAVSAYNKELRRVGGGQKVVLAATGQTFSPRELFHAEKGAEKAPEIEF